MTDLTNMNVLSYFKNATDFSQFYLQLEIEMENATQSMLPGAPWLLAHRSMLNVNQPRKIALYGVEYVIWQDVTGVVHALPNACPHMGAMLSEGWCEPQNDGTSTVVCPFHEISSGLMGVTNPNSPFRPC